jgi:hypothetical protein
MALNWKSIQAIDIQRACEELVARNKSDRTTGLIVLFHERALPAKEVLKIAYRNANGLDPSKEIKFSSGDGTLKILSQLGFAVERRQRTTRAPHEPGPVAESSG